MSYTTEIFHNYSKKQKKIVRYRTIALIAKLYKGKGGELLNLKKKYPYIRKTILSETQIICPLLNIKISFEKMFTNFLNFTSKIQKI